MAGTLLRVSQTKVGTWRACRAKFHYRYDLKLRRKRKERPLVFGDIVHQMIEADANGKDPFALLKEIEKSQGRMFRSMAEEYGAIVEDVYDIMSDYYDYWGNDLEYIRMNKKQAEFTFEVEIDKDIIAIGKIDNFAKTPSKLNWLVEHKTGKNIPNEDHRWKSIQAAMYTRIAEMIDLRVNGKRFRIDGTLWDFIRSKPPTRPQVKKDGELSARDIDTLPARVERFLEENKFNRKDKSIKVVMDKASTNRANYFQRIFTPTKKKVVDILFNDFIISARQIRDRNPKIRDMNIGKHCDWCSFEPICRATLRGYDVDFTIKSEYVVSEGHEDAEPDFEA